MRLCTNCGLNYEDHLAECPSCQGEVDPEAEAISATQYTGLPKRPNGSVMVPIGWCAVIVGAFCVLLGSNAEPTDFMGRVDPEEIAKAAQLMAAGEGFLQLGVLMLLAGYIVRAISFLPGKANYD